MSNIRMTTATIPGQPEKIKYKLVPVDGTMAGRIEALDRLNHVSDPITADEVRAQLENLNASYIAAVTDTGELVGYAGLQVVLDEGYLVNLTVKERYRRQGVGTELVAAFLRFGQANLSFLTLNVRDSARQAQVFFECQGFTPVGRRADFFYEPEEDAVLMTMNFHKGAQS